MRLLARAGKLYGGQALLEGNSNLINTVRFIDQIERGFFYRFQQSIGFSKRKRKMGNLLMM